MAMRVLQLGPYPPPHGGVQYNLVAIRNFLAGRDIPSQVINLTRSRQANADGVYFPKNWLQLLKFLFQIRCDILHLHIGGRLTPRLLGLSLVCCLLPGSKTVLTFHSGGYPSSKEGKTARPGTLRGFIFRRFDGIIAVNKEIAQLFRVFGIKPDRIRMIYPYDLPELPKDEILPEPIKSFLQNHHPVLSTVGLLEPEYDLPNQIDVLGEVRKKYPEAGLIIIGSGSIENELRERISSKDYDGDVLLTGDTPNTATLSIIAQSDLFLRTTVYDGDAISVREALHLGTQVIATDTGMRPEGVTLIPLSDQAALGRVIEDCLEHPVSLSPPPESARDNIAAVYEFYRELLQS